MRKNNHPQLTEQELLQVSDLTLKKATIPFHICIKLALKNMWKKKFRFLIVIIICSISLAFLSFTIELNGDQLRQNIYTMIENGYQYTDIKKYVPLPKELEKLDYYNKFNSIDLDNNSYQKVKNTISELNLHLYEEVQIDYAKKDIENANFFYPGYINTIIQFDNTNDYDLLVGRLPKPNENEMLITDYLASALRYFSVLPSCHTYYDYIGKFLDLNRTKQCKIVGVIKTNYEKWSQFALETEVSETNKTNYSFINDFKMMNAIILNEAQFISEKASIPDTLKFSTNTGTQRFNWSINYNNNTYQENVFSLQHHNISLAWYGTSSSWDGRPFGRTPIDDDEIVIPGVWLKDLFGEAFNSSFNFYYFWQNQVKGKTIQMTIETADKTKSIQKTFRICGLTTNSTTAQVKQKVYYDIFQTFNVTKENVIVQLPTTPQQAYDLFQKTYKAGYVINVWPYKMDIDSYTVDPFIDIAAKAGLFVFAVFTMGIMWTIITIEIVDSKKEIGILRSIGLSGFKVSFIFIFQTIIVNFVAYLLAIFLASKAIVWYNSGITDELQLITLYMYNMTYRTPIYLLIFIVVMTFVATFFPLYKIMSHKIIDVINERD